MVLIAATVEDDPADPVGLGPLRHQLAHDLGRGHVAPGLGPAPEVGRATVDGHQRTPRRGRSAVPCTFPRTRRCRILRPTTLREVLITWLLPSCRPCDGCARRCT